MVILPKSKVPSHLQSYFEPAQCGACFVCSMVGVFREVKRVLRDDGTIWLNLGDTFAGSKIGNTNGGESSGLKRDGRQEISRQKSNSILHSNYETMDFRKPATGLPAGNLVGIPWRVALALQADGWILRSDIPWVKRSSMPESVRNRPCKALEYVFLFAKKPGYYFDMESVRRAHAEPWRANTGLEGAGSKGSDTVENGANQGFGLHNGTGEMVRKYNPAGRSFRNADFWFDSVDAPHGLTGIGDELVGLDVTAEGYPGKHFAVFPSKLIEPMIKAGTSERGCCAKCGAPWRRVVERTAMIIDRSERTHDRGRTRSSGTMVEPPTSNTVGWEPGCACFGRFEKTKSVRLGYGDYNVGDDTGVTGQSTALSQTSGAGRELREFPTVVATYTSDLPLEDHPVIPCTVLDPFAGSGTTALTSLRLGRRAVGIDLSEEYLRCHAVERVKIWLAGREAPASAVSGVAGVVGEEV